MYSKNDVAQTPPMGWNSYDFYDTTVTEKEIKANADYMAAHLKEAGYEYVVVDIQWSDPIAGTDRKNQQYINFSLFNIDEYGRQLPAENRFPSSKDGMGFKPLADHIHNLGLKFGIHIMRGIPRIAAHTHMPIKGTDTTADQIATPYSLSRWNADMYGVDHTKPGAQDYYNSIFELYAEWGVDYVKVDDICNTNFYPHNPYSAEKEIEMIANAIENSGRPMVLSLSPGPAVIEKSWHLKTYANMWRITDDFWDDWSLLKPMFERCDVWQRHVMAGSFPDCDMLPLGKIGRGFDHERLTNFTYEEQKTMMTLWTIFRSPLMIGAELTSLDDQTLSLLNNQEVNHVLLNGYGAAQVKRNTDEAVWISFDKESNTKYIALFNLSDTEKKVSVTFEEVKAAIENQGCINDMPCQDGVCVSYPHIDIRAEYDLRDLWNQKSAGKAKDMVLQTIPAHGAMLFSLT